ncbi:hypothetical protein [Chromobacterium vaccinii]|uniref:hypothetical protein n=1 Tax=Chromobacterium vaccinii TaxID=1108595 RepID=UPI0011C02422|nr:hypothetical protein [Chromobacterium vaccinii]
MGFPSVANFAAWWRAVRGGERFLQVSARGVRYGLARLVEGKHQFQFIFVPSRSGRVYRQILMLERLAADKEISGARFFKNTSHSHVFILTVDLA